MRVLVLTRYSRMGASSRMRSLQYIDTWTANEHDFHIFPLLNDAYLRMIYSKQRVPLSMLASAYGRRVRVLMRVREFDLVWFEKELFPSFPPWFEWWLARSGVPYMVDYDDAIFHGYDLSANPFKRLLKNKIRSVMRNAALVVPGNDYLARYALESGAPAVEQVPTVIDIRRYPRKLWQRREQAPHKPFVIGWIGSPATVKFLRPLLPVMEKLSKVFPVELMVVGAEPDVCGYDFVRCIAWQEESEVEQISRFDIGVMPLPDEPWERGKCGYKLIQYMACGKPVVASPVGMNKELVQDGQNGFLAGSASTWFEALAKLLSDPQLRLSMGREGRMLVEQKYCLQVTAPRLLHLLEQVVFKNKAARCAD